jgi:hypothetical protein
LSALWRSTVIFYDKLDITHFELGERHFRGVLHRLRRESGVPLPRQRQDQRDANLAVSCLRGSGGLTGKRRRAAP